jgi:hypothetical protein
MSEFTAPSGAKVKINVAPFLDAEDLKDSILQEIARQGIDLRFNLAKGKDQDIDFGAIINAALVVASSKEVRKSLNKCLIRCTYDGEKIVPETTFEKTEARQDYHDIQLACLKANLSPFFESLVSKLKPFMPVAPLPTAQTKKSQK